MMRKDELREEKEELRGFLKPQHDTTRWVGKVQALLPSVRCPAREAPGPGLVNMGMIES